MVLPLIARVGGVDGWAAVSVGQAVGGLGGLVAGLGWGLTGPSDVASSSAERRKDLYAQSVASRLVVLAVVLPVCAVITFLLSPRSELLTALLMTVFVTGNAMSPGWYAIGTGQPSLIARYEVIPRLIAIAASAVCILAIRSMWVFPSLLLFASFIGTVAFGRRVVGVTVADVLRVRALSAVWNVKGASATVVIGGAYTQTPIMIVGALASVTALARYGSADRLYRMGLIIVFVLTNALQGWVSESAQSAAGRRRMRIAMVAHLILGAVGGIGLSVLGPFVSAILFGSNVEAGGLVSLLLGVAFVAVTFNSAAGRLILIPLGAGRQVLIATTVGAVLGLSAMVVCGMSFGPTGVAAGFAVSEVSVSVVQLMGIRRLRRQPSAALLTT